MNDSQSFQQKSIRLILYKSHVFFRTVAITFLTVFCVFPIFSQSLSSVFTLPSAQKIRYEYIRSVMAYEKALSTDTLTSESFLSDTGLFYIARYNSIEYDEIELADDIYLIAMRFRVFCASSGIKRESVLKATSVTALNAADKDSFVLACLSSEYLESLRSDLKQAMGEVEEESENEQNL